MEVPTELGRSWVAALDPRSIGFRRALGLALGGLGIALGALGVSGCNWAELDAIEASSTSVVDASFVEESASVAAPDASEVPVADSSPDQTASPLPCTSTQTVIGQWTFDSDIQGWALSMDTGVQGDLTWTSGLGDPSPGALEVHVTRGSGDAASSNGAWLQYDTALGNLSGRTVSAWVWLDSGPTPHFKLYVQTGSQYVWADNGTVYLTPHTWTCVSLPVSSPSYNGDNYDPTSVVRLGFEMLDSEPFRLYVDSVRYY